MELVSLFGFENRAFELLFSHEVCSWSVIGESSWATHPTSRLSNRSVRLFVWKPTVDLNRGSWEKLGAQIGFTDAERAEQAMLPDATSEGCGMFHHQTEGSRLSRESDSTIRWYQQCTGLRRTRQRSRSPVLTLAPGMRGPGQGSRRKRSSLVSRRTTSRAFPSRTNTTAGRPTRL